MRAVDPARSRFEGLETLSPARWRRWEEMYRRHGTRVQQSPAYARAVAASGRRVAVALAGDPPDAIGAFALDGSICTALGGDHPLLVRTPTPESVAAVVADVHRATRLPVYLPLVDTLYARVRAYDGFAVWERSPNSLIDWAGDGAVFRETVERRGGSHLSRKRRLVERDGLTLSAGHRGPRAADNVLRVDGRSWKAERGQGMAQRPGQERLYRRLVEDGTLTASFLLDHDRPVAFRLDARVGDRVMCLKWSHDEAYRRYSPGLYLLTEGLLREWTGCDIRTVDLHGGPDTLKDLLHSVRVPRVDLWCGDRRRGELRAEERSALDARVGRARESGRGLRHVYDRHPG
ncbi:GNAT family N-acetyltransferase [Streptomyces alkaliphilus]|uniref:GNAT family N-acetyltransferase n=1 Tax=Streptomyces alkaliphilus TaxID=1472722 RepID=UPI001565738B|nr:GNAT family N-acetyltransferase [Streptomyces alkaliphilus]